MKFSVQTILENQDYKLIPLEQGDFESLYEVASDPNVWEQHPNKDRYQREVFKVFFQGAMDSKGAFKIVEKATGNIIGSSRYYAYNEEDNSIFVGYTFYGTAFWGKGINPQIKKLMLDYVFQFVDKVHLHVGKDNMRSRIAVERLGAENTGELEVAYIGEPTRTNIVYQIKKENWL
ncbi:MULTISPECIES: GNAT family N-acetyltransferase [Chryseobacterium]|uniref:RimJ/RimL family protein N-acetyltransferase n=1 Tax=Chryseobacterium camelliae TaxID=1265445 RepID=A0ABU0TFN7_9FLAO|nr:MULTISPECIES: GNAT family N-acetyltransferase [Chryseobacterium]MDT3406419.1 RimJ/RimL family protein N-acetyltransferase [Pseudacidovorax intermedius]MDQ1095781.1 RimJ/RimL family protein N-acetyltransferase [Chryseobacterium camelliae]MDQ1099718.1 RimJ/RimL family protein N-acetyltransferase [Chryseobacterium sp. SORGH_AS_1048]MDR6087066.1 RimJ/RimL family protein N-acetyltransferase [Chryseobacterium sp. SORGH_AS_0909]MDR6131439.1 RimJ/RimL family protein N-acetyltransferase [Chryseobact